MKSYQKIHGKKEGSDLLEKILKEDYMAAKETLEIIDHRIAERKKLEYKNFVELERQRQRIEEAINKLQCFEYNPNPKLTMVKSKLETEMIKIELKVGEEAVNAFRDVEKLEAEKRNILAEIRSEQQMIILPAGGYQ